MRPSLSPAWRRPASHMWVYQPGLRIRIPIGSGFNRVSGSRSGSVFGIRIRNPDPGGGNDPQKYKKLRISCFEVLDVLFWELKASFVTWTSFMAKTIKEDIVNTRKGLALGFRICIHLIRIRIHHFRLNTNPDADPILIQGFYNQKLKKIYSWNKKLRFLGGSKTTINTSLGLKTWNFLMFSTFVGHFCHPGSGSGFRKRIQIHWPDWIRIQNPCWNTTDLFTKNNWCILASKVWRISPHTVKRLNTVLCGHHNSKVLISINIYLYNDTQMLILHNMDIGQVIYLLASLWRITLGLLCTQSSTSRIHMYSSISPNPTSSPPYLSWYSQRARYW